MPSNGHTGVEILRPSRAKWVLVLLGCVAFVALGRLVHSSPRSLRDAVADVVGIFFGLGGLVALIQLVPGASFLRLAPDGLTLRSMWRTTFFRWSDIERFGVAEIETRRARQRMVGLDLSSSHSGPGSRGALRAINRDLMGFDDALPDNYGMDCARLAEHLNRMKEKYTTTPPGA